MRTRTHPDLLIRNFEKSGSKNVRKKSWSKNDFPSMSKKNFFFDLRKTFSEKSFFFFVFFWDDVVTIPHHSWPLPTTTHSQIRLSRFWDFGISEQNRRYGWSSLERFGSLLASGTTFFLVSRCILNQFRSWISLGIAHRAAKIRSVAWLWVVRPCRSVVTNSISDSLTRKNRPSAGTIGPSGNYY